jgi:hypothetical protein
MTCRKMKSQEGTTLYRDAVLTAFTVVVLLGHPGFLIHHSRQSKIHSIDLLTVKQIFEGAAS